jgi:hypothetical protein
MYNIKDCSPFSFYLWSCENYIIENWSTTFPIIVILIIFIYFIINTVDKKSKSHTIKKEIYGWFKFVFNLLAIFVFIFIVYFLYLLFMFTWKG